MFGRLFQNWKLRIEGLIVESGDGGEFRFGLLEFEEESVDSFVSVDGGVVNLTGLVENETF